MVPILLQVPRDVRDDIIERVHHIFRLDEIPKLSSRFVVLLFRGHEWRDICEYTVWGEEANLAANGVEYGCQFLDIMVR